MEVKTEKDFFVGAPSSRNLIVADEKDVPHLIKRIKEKVKGEVFYFGEEQTFSEMMNELLQPSLFGGEKIFIITNSESYSEEQWKLLFKEKEGQLFFLQKSAKKTPTEKFKKYGSFLSLTEEKPWERKNRLVAEAIYTIHKDGIQISQPVATSFVDRVFFDLHLFHTELDKLRAFAHGRQRIDERDIDALIAPLPEENAFKVAEEILWKGKLPENFPIDTISTLLQVIGAFRFGAYLGLKLLSKEPAKIPPWQEKKYKQKALHLGPHFFKKVLTTLFEIEERAKQSSLSPQHLFDLLVLQVLSFS
ncbi:hypothetical protein K0U07_04580 [bacterium]|nr:hypothetical protein [bacterium]